MNFEGFGDLSAPFDDGIILKLVMELFAPGDDHGDSQVIVVIVERSALSQVMESFIIRVKPGYCEELLHCEIGDRTQIVQVYA